MAVITDNIFAEKFFKASGVPKELETQLFLTIRQKLPAEVDDAVINDIIATNMEIVKNYFISQQTQRFTFPIL